MNHRLSIQRGIASFVFGILLFATVSTASAQGGFGSPEQRAERMKAQLTEIVTALGVTGDLETQVRGILENQQKERTALMESYMGSGERGPETMQKMRAEMDDLDNGTRDELVPILSAEQLTAYDKKMAEYTERRGAGGRRGQGASVNR